MKLTEKQFQTQVIQLAKLRGWRVAHFRPARVMKGGKETWRTPVEGHNGFPDLVLARDGFVLLVELKTDMGTLSDDQERWLLAAQKVAAVWRPRNWPHIEAVLRDGVACRQ